MIQGGDTSGYTIVEAMVFLAVTAMLFVSAINLISGRQATVQFSQATRDAQSKVQDIINQVSTGFYPNPGDFSCTAAAGTLNAPVPTTTSSAAQGTSNTCVFLGKVVQFGTGTDKDGINVFSVASRRVNAAGVETSTLAEARPTALAPTSSASTTLPDLTEKTAFQYGLQVTRVTIPNPGNGSYQGSAFNYGAIAFLSSFPNVSSPGSTTLISGAQHVNFGMVPSTTLNDDIYAIANSINAMTSTTGTGYTVMSPDATLAKGIVICLQDQGSRRAKLTIGGGVSDTSVKLDIGSFDICTAP